MSYLPIVAAALAFILGINAGWVLRSVVFGYDEDCANPSHNLYADLEQLGWELRDRIKDLPDIDGGDTWPEHHRLQDLISELMIRGAFDPAIRNLFDEYVAMRERAAKAEKVNAFTNPPSSAS